MRPVLVLAGCPADSMEGEGRASVAADAAEEDCGTAMPAAVPVLPPVLDVEGGSGAAVSRESSAERRDISCLMFALCRAAADACEVDCGAAVGDARYVSGSIAALPAPEP